MTVRKFDTRAYCTCSECGRNNYSSNFGAKSEIMYEIKCGTTIFRLCDRCFANLITTAVQTALCER